jgi:putative transposase
MPTLGCRRTGMNRQIAADYGFVRRSASTQIGRLAVSTGLNYTWSMLIKQEVSRGRHCVFALHVHLVFVTKYRDRVFDGDAINRLRALFTKICADFESELVELDGEDHHVHLLVRYPPKFSVSQLVNSLKGVSSRMLRQQRPDLARRYWKGVLWSPSYFAASCGGAPINILKEYIEQQQTPD